MTMTKADIVERIYEKVGFSKKEATEVVEAIFELVKVRLHEPEDKHADAAALAEACEAHLCGLVGHTVILYRRHPEKPRIVLPQRGAARPKGGAA